MSSARKEPDAGMQKIRSMRGMLTKIAREMDFTTPAILKWKRVPAEYLPVVEAVTGIPRHELRPDICFPPSAPTSDAPSGDAQ